MMQYCVLEIWESVMHSCINDRLIDGCHSTNGCQILESLNGGLTAKATPRQIENGCHSGSANPTTKITTLCVVKDQ